MSRIIKYYVKQAHVFCGFGLFLSWSTLPAARAPLRSGALAWRDRALR
jgi:hypothetical protein